MRSVGIVRPIMIEGSGTNDIADAIVVLSSVKLDEGETQFAMPMAEITGTLEMKANAENHIIMVLTCIEVGVGIDL